MSKARRTDKLGFLDKWNLLFHGSCEKHGTIYESSLIKICEDCWSESCKKARQKEREEKIEIIKEAIIRANSAMDAKEKKS